MRLSSFSACAGLLSGTRTAFRALGHVLAVTKMMHLRSDEADGSETESSRPQVDRHMSNGSSSSSLLSEDEAPLDRAVRLLERKEQCIFETLGCVCLFCSVVSSLE